MPRGGDYDGFRESQARISRERSLEGRGVVIPKVKNKKRRDSCELDLERFLTTYFPSRFPIAFADVHRRVINQIQTSTLDESSEDNLFALAFMRGGGKTTIAEAAVLWAVMYGHRQFVVLVQATQPLAARSLKKIRQELESNDLLAADFPEVVAPIRALERIHNRARGQFNKKDNEPTNIELTAEGIVLPTVSGSKCSGSAIHVAGITGAIKGLSMSGPDGVIMRPDLVLIDDCQTRESAKSPTQTADREAIITDDILNLAGPGRSIAAIFLCTPIYLNDLPERFLDKDKHPEWNSQRTSMLVSMPKNLALWDEYGELRRAGLREDRGTKDSDEFYVKNRAAMDEGAVSSWPDRLSAGPVTASTAIELAMILYYQNPRGFHAEYQCKPSAVELEVGAKELSAGPIAARVNGVERYQVPEEATRLTAFIDCGLFVHWYAVVAWNESFGGAIVDYGSWPRQNRSFFVASDARPTLAQFYNQFELTELANKGLDPKELKHASLTPSQLVFAGLQDLSKEIFERVYFRRDSGEVQIERCLVDSGYESKAVYEWIRQSQYSPLLYASKGFARTTTSHGIGEWKKRPGERAGYHWRLTKEEGERTRCVQFDPDMWKSYLFGALNTPPGGRNGIFLYGKSAGAHEMISHHFASEYSVPVTIRGKTFDKWSVRVERPDNHLLDCLVGNAVAVSVQGLQWQQGALSGQYSPPAKRSPVRLSEIQSARRESPQASSGGKVKVKLSDLQRERRLARV